MRLTTENYEITPRDKILDPRNTHEKKAYIHKIPTRKHFGPRNKHDKNFRIQEISMRKNLWPTKYQRRHDDTRPTRITMTSDTQSLVHSLSPNIDDLI